MFIYFEYNLSVILLLQNIVTATGNLARNLLALYCHFPLEECIREMHFKMLKNNREVKEGRDMSLKVLLHK